MYMFMFLRRILSCGNLLYVYVCIESFGCSILLYVNVNYVYRILSCNMLLLEYVNVYYVNRDLRCSMLLYVNVNYIYRIVVVVSKLFI